MDIALTILAVVLWIAVGLLGFLLLLLSIPLSVRLCGELPDDIERATVEAKGSLGFVLLRFGLDLSARRSRVSLAVLGIPIWKRNPIELVMAAKAKKTRKKKGKSARTKKKKDEKEKEAGNAGQRMRKARHMLSTPHMGAAAAQGLRALGIFGSLEGRLGFSEPSSTAVTAALIGALRTVAPKVGTRLELDYLDEVCDLRGEVGIRLWVPWVVFCAGRFFVGRKGREMIRHWRSAKTDRAVAA